MTTCTTRKRSGSFHFDTDAQTDINADRSGGSVGHCSSSSFAPILRRLSTRAAAQQP